MKRTVASVQSPAVLLQDLQELIDSTRQAVSRGVNAALVLLYWKVGERIRRDVLKERRVGYGDEIVSTLSKQLGWSHFVELLPLKKHLQREFYAERCVGPEP